MATNAAQTSFWRTSDIIIVDALLVGLILDYVFPLSLANLVPAHLRAALGGLVISIGALIVIIAKVQFTRAKQPSAPGKPTTLLVQNGIFRLTRNPIYLGLVIALPGLALAFDMPWWALLTPPAAVLMHRALIVPEERYLAEKFGQEYVAYRARVRRWI
jgi:protein-S-isoprenylcysteine O-methyltransferase Ste14